jgi:hypothetical protein
MWIKQCKNYRGIMLLNHNPEVCEKNYKSEIEKGSGK